MCTEVSRMFEAVEMTNAFQIIQFIRCVISPEVFSFPENPSHQLILTC